VQKKHVISKAGSELDWPTTKLRFNSFQAGFQQPRLGSMPIGGIPIKILHPINGRHE
jgi:hypothetical protein